MNDTGEGSRGEANTEPALGTREWYLARLSNLTESEQFWRDRQPWLEQQGYRLRARYRPGWRPSWEGTSKDPHSCEDSLIPIHDQIMDATRISDNVVVALKKVNTETHPYEAEITRFFSTEPLASHPRNHCIPVYDVLDVPDERNMRILVLPLLRIFYDPTFKTIGEAIDFVAQILEGLQFMHECRVAHRDCMNWNIMMDPAPLFPKLYHPQADHRTLDYRGYVMRHHNRTSHPTRYYLIDFGLSRKYPNDGPTRDYPIWGGDKSVPEFQHSDDLYDPFPTDIYYIGNMLREEFLQKYTNMGFMSSLVADMVQEDPSKRPTIDEAVRRFSEVRKQLPWWKLRSRLVQKNEDTWEKVFRIFKYTYRTVGYIVTFRPAVPSL